MIHCLLRGSLSGNELRRLISSYHFVYFLAGDKMFNDTPRVTNPLRGDSRLSRELSSTHPQKQDLKIELIDLDC